MRRSGNHAVLHWIADHFKEKPWVVHNTSFNSPDPFEDYYDFPQFYDYRDKVRGVPLSYHKKSILIQTFEDCDISNLDFKANEEAVGSSAIQYNILIIRDPFNWLASRYAKPEWPAVAITSGVISLWKQHFKESIGWTDFIPNKIVIDYNKMCCQSDYLNEIEDLMHMNRTDIQTKTGMGIGSSFNDSNFLSRWLKFKEDPNFMGLLDEELCKYKYMIW